jgi:hypothetical protein
MINNINNNNNNIYIRCEFIELLDHLENISIEYVDMNKLNDFIFIDAKNNLDYKISKVINNNEIYKFQYTILVADSEVFKNIPNAEFHPDIHYDFHIDLINKKFSKKDEFIKIDININNINNIELIKKNKSLLRKILGC